MMKMSGMPNMGMFGNMNYQDMDIPENQKIKKKIESETENMRKEV